MTKLLDLFDIVPGWLYAIAIAVLLAALGAQALEVSALRGTVADVKRQAAEADKKAAEKLVAATARVLTLERTLNDARNAQEKTDAENRQTVAKLQADLRARSRAAGGPGLRDPWAKPCTATSAAAAASAPAPGGAGDRAETGRVLSPELEGLLLDRLAEADAINVAYASCRPNALNLRAKVNAPNPPPAMVRDPAVSRGTTGD